MFRGLREREDMIKYYLLYGLGYHTGEGKPKKKNPKQNIIPIKPHNSEKIFIKFSHRE